ncbi:hypothetical protein [Agarivorans sp. Z349TD_8]|uniref:hypothetical protein n=1 Tax=Agarivorans sp. Z349TD_8 TaxID=3421434 RepID=UPI003D7D2761
MPYLTGLERDIQLSQYFAVDTLKQIKKIAPKISFVVAADIKLANLCQDDIDIAMHRERPTDNRLNVGSI